MPFRSLFALLLVLAALAAPMPATAGETVVRVGAPLNLSGPMSLMDKPCLEGAKLKAGLLNEAGAAGMKISMAFIDTNTSAMLTMAAGLRLVSLGVPVAVGPADPAFVKAASQVFQSHGAAFVAPMATHPELPEEIGNSLFMISFTDPEQARAMAAFARESLKIQRVSIWTDEDSDSPGLFSQAFAEEFTASGGSVGDRFFFDRGEDDFDDAVAGLRKAAPDAVLVSALPLESGRIVERIRQAGLDLPILGGLWFDSGPVAALAAAGNAENVYFAAPAFRGSERPEATEFLAAYAEAHGKAPNGFTALCYDAVGLIADALRRAGATDRASLLQALAATQGYPGVTGKISYTKEDRMPAKPLSILGVQQGELRVLETLPPAR